MKVYSLTFDFTGLGLNPDLGHLSSRKTKHGTRSTSMVIPEPEILSVKAGPLF